MVSVLAGLSLGFVALAVLMTGVFLVMEGEISRMLLRCQGERVSFWTTFKIGLIGPMTGAAASYGVSVAQARSWP